MRGLKLAILVSGRGTVLKTVQAACERGEVDGEVVAVASNKECPALGVAREAGIATVAAYPLGDYASRSERDVAMAAGLAAAGADFVVVGGFDEALEGSLVGRYPDRIISMYPAILPAFGELEEAVGPALEQGVKLIGVTIHFRTAGTLSGGAIIDQEALRVEPGETVEAVTERVVELESRFVPRILATFVAGRVRREGDWVHLDQPPG